MTDIPIIFSAPMIRALLDGRKTMTRRLAWRLPPIKHDSCDGTGATPWSNFTARCDGCGGSGELPGKPSPWQKVKPGDRLYVRENWYAAHSADDVKPRDMTPDWGIAYAATYNYAETGIHGKTRPAIHMPRWASRLTLTVTAAKIERLQDISEEDAVAEGVCTWVAQQEGHGAPADPVLVRTIYGSCVTAFRALWESLHGAEAWDANPELVAPSFTVERRNIDAKDAA